jgi:hypothetical protein
MATQNVNVGINISDNGSAAKTIKSVKQLHSELEATKRTASSISTPKPAGYRGAAAPSGSEAMMSNQEYGRARGATASTGAAGRDFSNQAQGLGGIVRLYATYAANVFAVGAAFRALSNAMDTANLVKGLDQLGASSGTALGTLSKRLVQVTDGAISMREAMEATAKASSSGMSSENILRMGKVAKQAAQALGVDMADAVSRLTRGITKLEPELLDEIGIFTKVGMATEAYAKSVGKSTSAITDFEKRMAFANAVLEEGERKFSAIDFETNPYTKLLATLKDVAQTGLELVNTVFAPIVKFLSENPKALMLAIASLGAVLVKQALPALGQFKAGLAAAAEESTAIANIRKKDAQAAKAALDELISDRVNATQTAIGESTALLKKVGKSNIQAVQELVAADLTVLTKENIASVNTAISAVEAQADAIRRQRKTAEMEGEGPKRLAQLKAEEDALRNFANVNRAAAEDEKRLASEVGKQNIIANLNQEVARQANIKSVKDSILANAAYNGSLIGPTGALKLMNVELAASGLQLNAFSKGLLFARAALTAFAGAVTTVMAAIGSIMNIIAVIGAAFAGLSSMLSKNDKEMADFDTSITAVDESLKNLGRTLDHINDKPFGEQYSTKSLSASATAVNEISDSIVTLTKNTLAAGKSASSFDEAWDGLKSLFGGGRANNFGEVMSKTVLGTFEKLDSSPALAKAKASIAGILDIDPTSSIDKWEGAFAAITDNEDKLNQVSRAMKALAFATAETADRAEQFDLAMTQSKEALRNLTDQFKVRDPLALFAESIVSASQKTAEALKEPEAAIARLADVVNDPSKIALFGPEDQTNIIKYSAQITEVNKKFEQQSSGIRNSTKAIQDQQDKVDALNKKLLKSTSLGETQDVGAQLNKAKSELDARRSRLAEQQKAFAQTQAEVVEVTRKFPNVAANQFAQGAGLLEKSIDVAFAKANTAFADAVMGAVGDLPGLADQRYKMEMRKLDSESALLQANIELARQTAANTVALQRTNAENTVKSLEAGQASGDSKDAKALAIARKELDDIVEKERLLKIDPSQALGALKQVTAAAKNGNSSIAKESGEILSFLSSMAGFSLQQLNLQDAKAAENFKLYLERQEQSFRQTLKIVNLEKGKSDLVSQELDLIKTRNGFLTEEQIIAAGDAKIASENLARSEKELEIARKLNALDLAQTRGGSAALKPDVYEEEKRILLAQQETLQRQTLNKLANIQVQTSKEITAESIRLFNQEQALVAIRRSGTDALTDSLAKIRETELATAKTTEKFTPEYQQQLEDEAKAQAIAEAAKRSEIALTAEHDIKMYALRKEAQRLLNDPSASEQAIDAILDRVAAEDVAYNKKKQAIQNTKNAELSALSEVEAARREAANFDNLISSLQTLEGIFKGMGSSVSSTVKAFGDASKAQKQYAASIADIEFERDAAQNPEDRAKFEKKLAQTQRDAAKSEISNYGRVAGAAKGLFKEKTAAYKILAATEKVMHITRLGMDVAEIISDMTKTKTEVAGAATRTSAAVAEGSVKGTVAVLNQGTGDPYTAIPRMAIMAAIVAGLLATIGGKSSPISNTGGAGSNDGTGTVFGDSGAKSESISRSLEIVTDADPVLMRNSLNMVRHLRNIDNNISKLGNVLVNVLGGETISSNMGIQTGFTADTRGAGAAVGGGIGAFFGPIGAGIGAIAGTLLDKIAPGVMAGVAKGLGFGKKVSVVGEGIQLGGQTIGDIQTSGVDASFYADVNTKKKSFGITTSNRTVRQFRDAGSEIEDTLSIVFKGMGSALLEVGGVLGLNIDNLTSDLKGYKVALQTIKLSGTSEEQTEQLEAALGKIGDQLFKTLLPSMKEFQKAGEGYMQTAIRVSYGIEEAGAALERLGIDAIKFSDIIDTQGEVGAEIVRQSIVAQETNGFIANVINSIGGAAEDLVDVYIALDTMRDGVIDFGGSADFLSQEAFRAAGGLDELADSVNSFYEAFTTEAQKSEVNTKKVSELFSGLSLALPNTREEVLALVNALTSTDPKAAAKIMSATEILDKYYSTLEEASNRILDERAELEDRLFKLTATSEQIRQKELDGLDASNRALQEEIYLVEKQLEIGKEKTKLEEDLLKVGKTSEQLREVEILKINESNRALQREVWARQDMVTSLNDTIKKFETFSKNLRDFRDNLVLGSSSILTPLEKYAESKLQFEETYAKALAGDAEAQGKVTNSAQTFLNASKEYFASSSEYTKDFNSVLDKVGYGITSAESSISVAELQLSALTSQTDLLSSINTNIAILAGVSQTSSGGSAVTVLGEDGPQLIAQPSNMFVPQTNMSGNMEAVVAELRELKTEVAELRKQQNQETGHLIAATYDAQSKNAEAVTQGVIDATKAQTWAQQAQQSALVS